MNKMNLERFCFLFVLSLPVSVFADYRQEIINDSPIAWWHFNEYMYKDGLSAIDSMGNIHKAVFANDAMIVSAGIDGKAGWFNGNKAGIDLGNELAPLLNGSSAITFEAWIKNSTLPANGKIQRIFATRINGGTAGLDVSLVTSNNVSSIRTNARSNYAFDSYAGVNAPFSTINQWAHIVCIADFAGDCVKIYINGNLAVNQTINFYSNVYTCGISTERDQIGRTPTYDSPYRGFLDEVAIYNKTLTGDDIVAHYLAGAPAEPANLWVSTISDGGGTNGYYMSSPFIHKFANGIIAASHDYYGTNKPAPTGSCVLKISYNNGRTWYSQGQVNGVYNASLFEHNGALYIMGLKGGNPGHISIAKSLNYGATWTSPTDNTNGLLFEAQEIGNLGYSTSPVPVLIANGRIYRVYEKRIFDQPWPTAYAALIISADVNSNLLNAANWTMTNIVPFEPSWAEPSWNCSKPGWLEGNAVQTPNGKIIALMRFNAEPTFSKAAILTLSQDNTTLSFNPSSGFIDMPGGDNKFHILRDTVTGKYLSLVNNNSDNALPIKRNTVSLIASDDLINWSHVRTIIQDDSAISWSDSVYSVGFQYIVWEFDGKDIIFISRTAYDGSTYYHDANKVTFHRLNNYLDFVAACGQWGYSLMDYNRDCFVDMFDLNEFIQGWLVTNDLVDYSNFANEWQTCTQPYGNSCQQR
jgi:hypothetical protein